MSFFAVILALLLEQARPLGQGNAAHAAMRAWVRWSSRNLDAGTVHHGWLAWGSSVLVPALVAWGVYVAWVMAVGWWAGVLWSVAVLYATLGFRQFSFHFTRIRDALLEGDDAAARRELESWQSTPVPSPRPQELLGRVIEFSALAAHHHVFGVLACFSILAAVGLGPMGAVLYRGAEFVNRYWAHQGAQLHPVSPAACRCAQQAWSALDWLPARLTATAFAVVGNFEEAVDGWRKASAAGPMDNDRLILAATAGAVNLSLPALAGTSDGVEGRAEPELGHLAVVVGLVWRTVVLWLFLLALLTLARLLG